MNMYLLSAMIGAAIGFIGGLIAGYGLGWNHHIERMYED